MDTSKKKPNNLLKHERNLRCWTHNQMADALERLCQEEMGEKRRKVAGYQSKIQARSVFELVRRLLDFDPPTINILLRL